MIDFSQPVALLMIAVLHVQQLDEQGNDIGDQIAAQYRELLPRGSYLTISHGTDEGVPPRDIAEQLVRLKSMYDSSTPVIWRTRQQIADLFGDFDLIDPGLTWTPSWHPEETGFDIPHVSFSQPSESVVYAVSAANPSD